MGRWNMSQRLKLGDSENVFTTSRLAYVGLVTGRAGAGIALRRPGFAGQAWDGGGGSIQEVTSFLCLPGSELRKESAADV